MKKILCFLLVLSCTINSISQSLQVSTSALKEANPASLGFAPDRLARIDQFINEQVGKQAMNGGVALILRDGKIAYYKAFGYDDIEQKKPMQKDAIFRIASQTKAITSVAIMMLYEEGKFLLDDPVSRFIPEFKNPQVLDKFNETDSTYTTVPAKREVSIRDLLTHTSGMGYAQIGTAQQNAIYQKAGVVGGIGVDKILLADKMKILAKLPLFHQPGEKWTYGLNTDMLGYLVEVVSGLPLDKFFEQRIFAPLGMKDTYFYIPKEKHGRLVTLYTDSDGKVVKMQPVYQLNGGLNRDFPNMEGTYFSGGGGLSSTAYDYAIFLQMVLNGGVYNGKRLLSRNTVRMMTMNQVKDLTLGAAGNKFGLGFGVTSETGSSIIPVNEGTFDWGGMFATTFWVDPKERLVGIFYRNIFPSKQAGFSNIYKVLVYQAIND